MSGVFCICCRWEAVPMHLGQLREEICPLRRVGPSPAHSHGWEALPVPTMCQTLHAQWSPDQARPPPPRLPPIHDRTPGPWLAPGSRVINQCTVSVNQQHPFHNLNPVGHFLHSNATPFFTHKPPIWAPSVLSSHSLRIPSPRLPSSPVVRLSWSFASTQKSWCNHIIQHDWRVMSSLLQDSRVL